MEFCLRTVHGWGGGAIVGSRVAFAKVIGLNGSGDATEELPIDFVKVVGEQDHAADDTDTWGCFDDHLDTAEEELEISPHGRGVVSLGKSEFSALIAEINVGIVGKLPLSRQSLGGGEVNGVGVCGETLVVGASHWDGQWGLLGGWGKNTPLVGSHSVVT